MEQEKGNRCINENVAKRFSVLMKTYNDRAKSVGSGFDMNPSPGNPFIPVIKLSSNTILAKKMFDIIDVNTGNIIDGEGTIEQQVKEYSIMYN
jgi:altronate dehydratase